MAAFNETKKYTRLSFWYPISYLVPASLVLIFAPQFLLDLTSNGNYSIYITRLVGAAMLAFTIMVLSVFYYKVEQMYNVVIYVRVPVILIVSWLYMDTHDPLFLILVITILPGVFFSMLAKQMDKRKMLKR